MHDLEPKQGLDSFHNDNFQILRSNHEKINDIKETLHDYYLKASRYFFSGFGQEELEAFKVAKRFLDTCQMETNNCAIRIYGALESEKKFRYGMKIIENLAPLKELSNLSNLEKLTLKNINTSFNSSELLNFILRWEENSHNGTELMARYNETLMPFKNLQTEQYEIMGTYSKALHFFFNYENPSRKIKQYIINLNLEFLHI
jgi:hypothetical protein